MLKIQFFSPILSKQMPSIKMLILVAFTLLLGSCRDGIKDISVKVDQYPDEIISSKAQRNFNHAKMSLYVINFNNNINVADISDTTHRYPVPFSQCSLILCTYREHDSSLVISGNFYENLLRFGFLPEYSGKIVSPISWKSEISLGVIVDKKSNKTIAREINDGFWEGVTKNGLNVTLLKQYIDSGGKVDPWIRTHSNLLDSISSGWPPN